MTIADKLDSSVHHTFLVGNWNKLFLIIGFGLFFTLSSGSLNGQNLEYDIIWFGKVGKLYINKSAKEGAVFIETNSEVKIPFYTINWITTTTILGDKLKSSAYSQLLNGNKREFTEISQISDNSWQMVNEKGISDRILIQHFFYASKLYFEEPVNINYVFSERFGGPLEMVNKGNGHYRLMLPEENYCDYYYENGVCKIVKAKNGNRTIKMVLVEPTEKKG